jgi:uncharacterized protein
MSEPQAPKIEFPCSYPIKVLGRTVDHFHLTIIEIFERHAPGFDQTTITAKSSSGGTFTSLTITIEATGPDQLSALHSDLMETGLVSMVI